MLIYVEHTICFSFVEWSDNLGTSKSLEFGPNLFVEPRVGLLQELTDIIIFQTLNLCQCRWTKVQTTLYRVVNKTITYKVITELLYYSFNYKNPESQPRSQGSFPFVWI